MNTLFQEEPQPLDLRARHEAPRSPSEVDESLVIDPTRPGAYQWWYFDATSDDEAHSLVVIVFVGSVFSPWYFSRLAKGEAAKPKEHCAVNVALTSKRTGASRWVFSEYDRFDGDIRRGVNIGRSSLSKRSDGVYELSLDDRQPAYAMPLAVKGRVRFTSAGPTAVPSDGPFVLDRAGAHRWAPVAPRCRVDVDLTAPNLRFSGDGYHDINHGDEPLGAAFTRWHWARSHERERTRIRYDRALRDNTRRVLDVESTSEGLRFDHRDELRAMELALGGWTLMEPAALRVDDATVLKDVRRVESSPFYARYTARTPKGEPAVGEHLDLDRFALPTMQRMLPFRARRG
jgi:carotenoid 1,2-hydratase